MLKYIKKAYIMSIASYNETPGQNTEAFKGDAGKDLQELRDYLKDGITTEEAKIISDNLEEINLGAQEGLKKVANSMKEEGFNTSTLKGYNSFQKIINKAHNMKLPEMSVIEEKLKNKVGNSYNSNKLKSIEVKGEEIKIQYDKFGMNDTLTLGFVDHIGNINKAEWSNEVDFYESFEKSSEISNVGENVLDEIKEVKEHLNKDKILEEFKKSGFDIKLLEGLELEELEKGLKLIKYVYSKFKENKTILEDKGYNNGLVQGIKNGKITVKYNSKTDNCPIFEDKKGFDDYINSLKSGKINQDEIINNGEKISFRSGKESYLPGSAYKEGYTHRLSLEEVAKAIGGNTENKLEEFQKIHNLGADKIIGAKTYKFIVDNLNKK